MRDENTPGTNAKAFISHGLNARDLRQASDAIAHANSEVLRLRELGWKVELSIRANGLFDAIMTQPETPHE